MPPDDILEDLARVAGGVDGGEDGVDRARPDRVAALDELDELVDHCARLADFRVVTLEREPVAAQ